MTQSRYPSHHYLGLDEIGDEAHIMVDGAPRPHSALLLSHWAISPTPRHLWRDLSAEIALAYLLDQGTWDSSASAVTNDHLDVDGLVGLFFLTNPEVALEHSELLVEVARIGDFGVVRSMQAAEITWVLDALMEDPDLAIVGLADSAVTPDIATTASHRALLQVFERIIKAPEQYAAIAGTARARFEKTRDDLDRGAITLEESLEHDLCIVHVGEQAHSVAGSEGHGVQLGLDTRVIHSATDASRILLCRDGRYVYYDRYETWVRYVSRHRHMRRDMTQLARDLSERDVVQWTADPASSLAPVLRHDDRASKMNASMLAGRLADYLTRAPIGWDPFRFSESGRARP